MEKMRQLGVVPSTRILATIVIRFCTSGNLELSLQYYFTHKTLGLIPELAPTQAVVKLAADSGYPRLAVDIVTWFEEKSVRRVDYSTWLACLASSAENLYVGIFGITFLPSSNWF